MNETFYISDLHLNHEKIPQTRGFSSVEEHDEAIVANWNSVVNDGDLVWCLGDVMLNVKDYTILGRLKGRKKLVFGNHDIGARPKEYVPYFEVMQGYHTINERIIVSHIPVHPRELEQRFHTNIHGHLHKELVLNDKGLPDLRYLNVSAEQINLTPISYDDIKAEIQRRKEVLRASC